jgi:hypothetical protein
MVSSFFMNNAGLRVERMSGTLARQTSAVKRDPEAVMISIGIK